MGDNSKTGNANTGSNRTIKSVETSISIIEALKQQGETDIKTIAESTGHSKANVYKHLNTLREHRFVEKSGTSYRLGIKYLDLGGQVRERIPGAQEIKRKISEVADLTGEVAQYMVEDGGKSVIVFKEVGHQGVSTRTRVGTSLPLHQVASGKAMLAFTPESQVEELLDQYGLPAATKNTITTREELHAELETIREQGYAVNRAESTKGLFAVAVPVRTPNGDAIGACAVSGPTYRMKDGEGTDRIVEILLSVANEIELNLAHS